MCDESLSTTIDPTIGVVVIYYSQPSFLQATLLALYSGSRVPGSTVIVDNCSPNPVPDVTGQYSGVEVLRNDINGGYAYAANRGISYLKQNRQQTSWILILTHESQLESDCLERLCVAMESRGGGICGPLLMSKGASIVWSAGGRFDSVGRPKHRSFVETDLQGELEQVDVEWVDGAALFFPLWLWDQVSGFDERYFLYYEEIDFCFRVRRAGYPVSCVAGAIASQEPGKFPVFLRLRNGTFFHLMWMGYRRTLIWLCAELVLVIRSPTKIAAALAGLRAGCWWFRRRTSAESEWVNYAELATRSFR